MTGTLLVGDGNKEHIQTARSENRINDKEAEQKLVDSHWHVIPHVEV